MRDEDVCLRCGPTEKFARLNVAPDPARPGCSAIFCVQLRVGRIEGS